MSRYALAAITTLALAGAATRADATAVFSGTSNGLSAAASFTIGGSQLTILLTNTDTASGGRAPMDPSQALTGLFFNLGSSTFTPQAGSIIQTTNCEVQGCSGQTDLGGDWSYFNGPNYEDPAALNGPELGLVPNSWVGYSGSSGLDTNALIEGTVRFVLDVGTTTLSESDPTNVSFADATSANQNAAGGETSGVPPTTDGMGLVVPALALLSMLLVALAGVAYYIRKPDSRR